jgi:hypothetical protein
VRRIERQRSLPGGRAVIGALLMAIAAVGVFVAYTDATTGPVTEYVVAAAELPPGHVLSEADLEIVAVDLPADQAARAFTDPSQLAGRVLLGPSARGEIVQAASVTDGPTSRPGHEVGLLLPRGHVAADRLQPGDRVDLLATTSERTTAIVRDALLVSAGGASGGAIGEEREVSVIVSVATSDEVTSVVHALRTADLTVVRSTFAPAPDQGALAGEQDEVTPEAASGVGR